MLEAIQSKPTTSGMAANGLGAARQGSDETAARTRGLTQNNPKPAAEAFSKTSNAAVQFGHGNLEAVAQSTQIYLTGMQDLSRQYVAAVQGLMQHVLEGTKAFAGTRSLKDAMAVQMNLTRASVQLALGEGAKLQQAALKLTERACAPLTQRATAALEQTKVSGAA
jgi:phasin family protein